MTIFSDFPEIPHWQSGHYIAGHSIRLFATSIMEALYLKMLVFGKYKFYNNKKMLQKRMFILQRNHLT